MMKKYDTIGIDCVGMCVNDLICTGLEPFAFLDYIATASPDSKTIAQISEGIVEGAKQAEVAVVGGETAVVPDLLSDGYDGTAIDLVGFAAGICSKNKLVLGDKVKRNSTISQTRHQYSRSSKKTARFQTGRCTGRLTWA